MARKNRHGEIKVPSPIVRTPQFPGVDPGMSVEAVRDVIRNQKRVKGFRHNMSAGANNDFSIALSGTARLFLGFALDTFPEFDPAFAPDGFTLTINNEIVIENVFPGFFSSSFMDDEYYSLPRPLSGQDTITATYNAPNDFTVFLAAYYI